MNHAHNLKTNHILTEATKHWKYIAPVLAYPKNEAEYNQLVNRLDKLLDIVGDDEKHPLIGLVDVLSHVIASYENSQITMKKSKGINALKALMEAHHLNQSDLPHVASQGVMSELLNEKRSLNLRQITLLAKYFNVDPSTFIDE
jgi:HTH-type transcriptional regulator / antitoxin HigA